MKRDWTEICAIIEARRSQRHPLLNQMMQVRERYNGDWILPEFDTMGSLTPTLIRESIDNLGLRAAGTMPSIIVPAVDPAKPTGQHSVQWATDRRKAWSYVWEESHLSLQLGRAYRQLAGYATSAFVVTADLQADGSGCPKIATRDPLACFPEPRAPEDLSPPTNCAFIYGRSADWLTQTYGGRYPDLRNMVAGKGRDELWDVVEWIDEHDVVLGILGPRYTTGHPMSGREYQRELMRWPNRAGRCTVVIPQQVSLDRIVSNVVNIVGSVDVMARLTYLDLLATEKSIIPDRYIIGQSAMMPQVLGNWKDGRTGEVNTILDAQSIGELRGEPSPSGKIAHDRLERDVRNGMGVSSLMSGEFPSGNLRSGQTGNMLMAASADPRIAEMHEIMALALTQVNEIVADTFIGWWPDRKYEVFSGWTSDDGLVKFTPSTLFKESKRNKVYYPIPGADAMTNNVILGQMVASDMASKRTVRGMHPYIKDSEAEERRILVEAIEGASVAAFLQQAASGEVPLADSARIVQLVKEGKEFHVAVQTAQREAQERQAQQAPQPGEGMAAAPETMPGLAMPGMGAEMQPPPSVPGPSDSLGNLDSILGALSAPVGQRA